MSTHKTWVDIPEYEDLYKINIDAELVSKKTGNNIYPYVNSFGYYVINLYKTWRKGQVVKIHRLLAICFLPNPNNYPAVNHINGIKTDNRIENLEWCTYKHNINEAVKLGFFEPQRKAITERNSKPVIDLNTGVFYENAKELANLIGIVPGTLHSWLNGSNPNKTNYRYV